MAVDTYNWMNDYEDEEDDIEPERNAFASRSIREPPIDEEVFEQTQGLMRRGASRSRSPSPQGEEQPSGSNQAMRLMRRGASRSRSVSPPKRNKK